MIKKIILLVFLLVITIGVTGCGQNQTTTNTATTPTSTKPTITKKPVTRDTRTDSYDFCESHGYEVIIRYDQTTDSSKVYCRFSDSTECEAEAYKNGICAPGAGSKTHEPGSTVEEEKVVCTKNYDPVCGENNITYSNSCIASINKIKVKNNGVCIQTQTTVPGQTSVTTPKKITKDSPDWINLVVDLIKSTPPKTPRAYINKCVYSDVITYFQSDGCASCYSVLYNDIGKAICYPTNDLDNRCPAFFKRETSATNCVRLWTDTR